MTERDSIWSTEAVENQFCWHAGVQHGRHLHQDTAAGPLAASDLEATPLNNSGKAAALTESAVRTKATMESIDAYIKKADAH